MKRTIRPGRLVALIMLLCTFIALYATGLYKLQVVEGKIYAEYSQNSIVSYHTVTAARGNILDRYGRLLVSNRVCNNITLNTNVLYGAGDVNAKNGVANAMILELVETVTGCGDSYNDTLPITMEPPFEYIENMSAIQSAVLNALLKERKLSLDTSAVELMAYFRERYNIDPSYDARQTRIIAGIRYETNTRHLSNLNTSAYVFAEDVSIAAITQLMESEIKGFEIQQSYIREYNTQYAAHILGYVGKIPVAETEKYRAQGYDLGAIVGLEGAELVFEKYLRGRDGEAAVTRTAAGTVVSTVYTEVPEPGQNSYLTIDIGLQEAAEISLAAGINKINAEREIINAEYERDGKLDKIMQYAPAGAVVAVNVKTGELLCAANYPTFAPERYVTDLPGLLKEDGVLYNRALLGTYPPGSTFKMITGFAALKNSEDTVDDNGNVIKGTGVTLNTTIPDELTFRGPNDKYVEAGYAPSCWMKGTGTDHGDMQFVSAIENSCNYYFFQLADWMNIRKIAAVAQDFGLGEFTGIELPEAKGQMSSPEEKAKLFAEGDFERDWFDGDTLQAAIGQSISLFTPLQLANYAAALANGGTLYKATCLKAVRSYDYSEETYSFKPEILNICDYDPEWFEAAQYGMRLVVRSGASPDVYAAFDGAGYIAAAKTGTTQLGQNQTNNGVFIVFAPYDDPEIAVAVVVEKGGKGSALAEIARNVLDYYFSFKDGAAALDKELTLMK